MPLRRAFYSWMFPAALVLPLWLLVGWFVFGASGWALVGTIFLAIPAVLIAEVVLTLLVRARASVREQRAVSWLDVIGFGTWHALIIVAGLFARGWSTLALVLAVLGAVAVLASTLWQFWRETTARAQAILRDAEERASRPQDPVARTRPADPEVFVISERDPQS